MLGAGSTRSNSSFKISDLFLYLDFHPKTQKDAQQKSTTGAVGEFAQLFFVFMKHETLKNKSYFSHASSNGHFRHSDGIPDVVRMARIQTSPRGGYTDC